MIWMQKFIPVWAPLWDVFNRDRERCMTDLVQLMMQQRDGHQLRSELALISNMARTIPDKESAPWLCREYTSILHEVLALPTSFGDGDVLDQKMASKYLKPGEPLLWQRSFDHLHQPYLWLRRQ